MSDKTKQSPKFYLEIITDIHPDLAVDIIQSALEKHTLPDQNTPHVRKINPIEETCSMLRKDPELYRGYRDNISVCFQDTFHARVKTDQTKFQIKAISDIAAENFLELWTAAPTPLGRNHDNDIIPEMERDLMETSKRANIEDKPLGEPYRPATRDDIHKTFEKERLNIPDPKADIEQKEKKSTHQEEYVDEILEKIKRAKEHPLLEYAIKHLDTMAEGCTDKDLKVMETTKLLLTMLISEDIDNTQMYASLSLAQAIMWKYYKRPNNSYAEMSSKEKAFREKITGGDFENEQAENSIENKA